MSDVTPDDDDLRLEELCGPLFDLWLRFEKAFARVAIDKLEVSDEDADAFASIMERTNADSGKAFAYLMRHIKDERMMRRVFHMAEAVFESQRNAGMEPSMVSMDELGDVYRKLHGGTA